MRSATVTKPRIPVLLVWSGVFLVRQAMAGELVQDQLRRLTVEDWRARQDACHVLGRLRSKDRRVVSALRRHLKDKDSLVSRAAAKALGKIGEAAGPAIPDLISLLDRDYVGIAASSALRNIGSQSIRPLSQVVSNYEAREQLRTAALGVLADFGPHASPSLKKLIGLLNAAPLSPEIRIAVCRALGAIGPAAHAATSALVSLCQHPDSLIRLEAARTLGKVGPLTTNEIRSLVGTLEVEQKTLRLISREEMDWRRQRVKRKRRPDEFARWEHGCVRVQIEMIRSLEKLQAQLSWKEARSTVMPALVNVLKAPHSPFLAQRCRDRRYPLRPEHHVWWCPHCHLYAAAAKALRFYGPEGKIALPILKNLLRYVTARREVKATIEAIQPSSYFDSLGGVRRARAGRDQTYHEAGGDG